MVNAPVIRACEAITPAVTESTTAMQRTDGVIISKKGFKPCR